MPMVLTVLLAWLATSAVVSPLIGAMLAERSRGTVAQQAAVPG